MKFAIVGAGGVGGYFGARLAADGNDVVFVARGAHREAMAAKGLKVLSPKGDLHIEEPELFEDAEATGLCDFVFLCVKLWDVEAAARMVQPLLAHDSAVVPLQNGVTVEDDLGRLVGPRFVLGGVAHIASVIKEPGVIEHSSPIAQLTFGELDGLSSWRQECLLSACMGAGIDAKVSTGIQVALWRKFIMLSPFAGAACLHRCTLGEILEDAERTKLLEVLIAETAAVGRAKGVALSEETEEKTLGFLRTLPASMKPSMLHDLEAGRRLELPWLNGAAARLGAELGVATPANTGLSEALKPYTEGARASN